MGLEISGTLLQKNQSIVFGEAREEGDFHPRAKSKRLEEFRGQNHQEPSFWRYDFISRTLESEILVVGIDTTRKLLDMMVGVLISNHF